MRGFFIYVPRPVHGAITSDKCAKPLNAEIPDHGMRLQPLKGFNAFEETFKSGKKFYCKGLIAIVSFHNAQSDHSERADGMEEQDRIVHYGVTSKRRTRPAVLRNRIKRLLREGLRSVLLQQFGSLETRAHCPFDSVVLIQTAIPAKASLLSLNDVLPSVRCVLQKATDYYRHNQRQTP